MQISNAFELILSHSEITFVLFVKHGRFTILSCCFCSSFCNATIFFPIRCHIPHRAMKVPPPCFFKTSLNLTLSDWYSASWHIRPFRNAVQLETLLKVPDLTSNSRISNFARTPESFHQLWRLSTQHTFDTGLRCLSTSTTRCRCPPVNRSLQRCLLSLSLFLSSSTPGSIGDYKHFPVKVYPTARFALVVLSNVILHHPMPVSFPPLNDLPYGLFCFIHQTSDTESLLNSCINARTLIVSCAT